MRGVGRAGEIENELFVGVAEDRRRFGEEVGREESAVVEGGWWGHGGIPQPSLCRQRVAASQNDGDQSSEFLAAVPPQ